MSASTTNTIASSLSTIPGLISNNNPIEAVMDSWNGFCPDFVFKLQSGEKTNNIAADDGFKDLDWSQITSLVIYYRSDFKIMRGFEFYN